MKLLNLCIALLMVGALAGCGNHDNDGHSHGNDNAGGHAGGHEHEGEAHPLGTADLGDGYSLEAGHIGAAAAGKEVVFEIVVKKGGKDLKDASVTCWIGKESGEELTTAATAEWVDAENLYDGHVMMPKELPADAQAWFRVRHDGKDMKKAFELTDHDHE